MKKILLQGYYGFGNAGDDALLSTILNEIDNENRAIDVLSKKPLNKSLIGDRENIELSNINLLRKAFTTEAIIYGGGSQLQDFGNVRNKLNLLRSLIVNLLIKFRKKEIIYLGISIGPIKSVIGNFLVKRIMKSATLIIVRDQSSLEYLEGKIPVSDKYNLSPDIVLSYKPKYIKEINGINKNETETVGINLMSHYSAIDDNIEVEEKILLNVIKIIEKNKEKKFRFFQFQNSSIMDDELIFNKLALKLSEYDKDISLEFIPYTDIETLISELNQCDYFFGMRLHSAVLCDVIRLPHVLLSYHPKCHGYAESLNYPNSMLIDCDLDNSFTDKIQKMFHNPNDFIVNKSVTKSLEKVNFNLNKVNGLLSRLGSEEVRH